MKALREHVAEFERPKRKAISRRFPLLVKPAVFTKRTIRSAQNKIFLPRLRKDQYFACVVARHSSPLFRKLGESDPQLQINKIKNLEIAIGQLNGLVIKPGQIFSFWKAVGTVSKKRGYVEGMILSNGQVSKGIGGGLCQLSNFLMWIFLHAETEIVERHHHSVDAFPDSGRTLPFGSGATIFSNYLDLKIKNTSAQPLQLKLWLTDNALKGQLLSDQPGQNKYHVFEKDHCFVKKNGKYFRYNHIYREIFKDGIKIKEEKIFTNFAPIVYQVDESKLREQGHQIVVLDQ